MHLLFESKGHKELPQVLYIVPWQEINKNTKN
jgi:hypothetical protein